MKVGFKKTDMQEIEILPNLEVEVEDVNTPLSLPDTEKFIVWHIEGGLGKNIAATALIQSLTNKHSDRKLIIVCSYPEVFLNHPSVYRVYKLGMTSYFYENYIHNKDTIIFRQEPYFQSDHILKKKHLIENWADLMGLQIQRPFPPNLYLNFPQQQSINKWQRNKPICLIQTNGGGSYNTQYSWSRDMPIELALYLTDKYKETHHIIQIANTNSIAIPGAEIINTPLSVFDLVSLTQVSDIRLLIDSSIQHIAAGLGLSSTVFWIGTSPQNFGYELHTNIKANEPKGNTKLIDSYLFDYSFEGVNYECPYNTVDEMFDVSAIDEMLNI